MIRHRAILGGISALLLIGAAHSQTYLPDHATTPGAINPAVVQGDIGMTICRPGYSRSVRPPEGYTEDLKRRQLAALGLPRSDLRRFEEDRLIPIELGGAPRNPRNLWLEPRFGEWSAKKKDELENFLHLLVCNGTVPLAEAQHEIAVDWTAAYLRYVDAVRPAIGH